MNGIDSIYDPSDVKRMLFELEQERIAIEEAKSKKIQGTAKVGANAWKMWANEERMRTKELLATGDYIRDPDVGSFRKLFTPSGGRVIPTEEFAEGLKGWKDTGKDWKDTGKIISDGRAGMRLPSGEVVGSVPAPKEFIDIRGPKTIPEAIGKPIKKAADYAKTKSFDAYTDVRLGMKDKYDTTKLALAGEDGAKTAGISQPLKTAGSAVGTGLSLYETISDWEKHDPKQRDVRRGLDVGKTALYAASMVPGPHTPFTLAGAGVLSLADYLWK